jgi:hypothetical protein
MNEEEWFSELDFTRHIQFMEAKLSARQTRLLAAAFCRKLEHLHTESRIHQAIETAEEFADGNRSLQLLEEFRQQCRVTAIQAHEESISLAVRPGDALKWILVSDIAWAAAFTSTTPVPVEKVAQQAAEILTLEMSGDRESVIVRHIVTADAKRNVDLRSLVWEITGNPFRPIRFLDEWRTSTATALARAMYQTRDFSPMPILADALQDAGCDNAAILDHCRDPRGVHIRGCWVLDRILSLM